MSLLFGILIGLVAGIVIAIYSPRLWTKWTTKAASELHKAP